MKKIDSFLDIVPSEEVAKSVLEDLSIAQSGTSIAMLLEKEIENSNESK